MTNAARYTPPGGRIRLDTRRDGAEVIIRVKDNGIGFPPEVLPTLFEMFYQVKAPSRDRAEADRSQGGLGIGLALARQLVELHGGRIEAESGGVGQGAQFVVHLPVADEAPPGQTAVAPMGPAGTRCLKVLIVDDNADLVEMLALVVASLGHDVRKAFDGRQALAVALSYRPDVVLLDVGLPAMSGIEVARELRRFAETRGSRLVALTGWGQPDDRRQTQEAGFDHHLTKPTEPNELEALLTEIAQITPAP